MYAWLTNAIARKVGIETEVGTVVDGSGSDGSTPPPPPYAAITPEEKRLLAEIAAHCLPFSGPHRTEIAGDSLPQRACTSALAAPYPPPLPLRPAPIGATIALPPPRPRPALPSRYRAPEGGRVGGLPGAK